MQQLHTQFVSCIEYKCVTKCILSYAVIQCPDIPDPYNGQILFTTDRQAPFDYGTTAQYVCDSGFSLIGDESMRVCEGDGQSDIGVWSGYDYTCQFIGE